MAASRRPDVLVIGAGVIGLSTAVRLAEAGLSVRIRAARPPQDTTSASAGASWGPYELTDARVLHWSEQTRLTLEKIAEDPSSGVRLVRGLEVAPFPLEPPACVRDLSDFELCPADELPPGYVSGWRYTSPLVNMPAYLEYLTERLISRGGAIEIGTVSSFKELAGAAGVLVNCTGLGARYLVPDDQVFPTRGQLVVVDNPGIDTFFQDWAEHEDMTYILPHGSHVVLGGSATPGSEDLTPDPARAAAIIERCAAVEPLLRSAQIRRILVGLRPSRPSVRIERDQVDGNVLIHNYGHGGSGLALSWGCADEVLALSELV
ncbi:FAD-dependent oxidoreductase [Plantactinospora mayteni]|uniref:D-amino-acid oxidase n=1 Tax=Plantactinospora mayteni TaxID=566021 RepID=A0ABQ4EXI2_9ACTN|nr:FAD-dependent oxidoreductase [Plantactinospora mayteni]GIG99380.1 amino acid oxidase [Plantactinospora mayteni]